MVRNNEDRKLFEILRGNQDLIRKEIEERINSSLTILQKNYQKQAEAEEVRQNQDRKLLEDLKTSLTIFRENLTILRENQDFIRTEMQEIKKLPAYEEIEQMPFRTEKEADIDHTGTFQKENWKVIWSQKRTRIHQRR